MFGKITRAQGVVVVHFFWCAPLPQNRTCFTYPEHIA